MIIHRAWEGDQPQWVKFTEKAVDSIHPGITVRTVPLDPQLPGPTPARRSNIHRLRVLLEQGGLWLDCDVIPLTNLVEVRDEPWMAWLDGWRPTLMFFPEPGHPLLEEALERALNDPDRILSSHLSAVSNRSNTVVREPRVIPHDATGNWILGNQQPLAVHLWFSSNRMGF